MINEKLEKAFNYQINRELYSEYLYLSMQAYFERLNLKGFVNWMTVQVQEEHAHAMGMFNYLCQRAGKIELEAIEKPEIDWNSPLEVFEHILTPINLNVANTLPTLSSSSTCSFKYQFKNEIAARSFVSSATSINWLINDVTSSS